MYSTNIGVFFNKEKLNYNNVKLDSRKNYIINPFFSSEFSVINKEDFDSNYLECIETVSDIIKKENNNIVFFNTTLKNYKYIKEERLSYKNKEDIKYIIKKYFSKKYEDELKIKKLKDLNHFSINEIKIEKENKDYFIFDINFSFYRISKEKIKNKEEVKSVLKNILNINKNEFIIKEIKTLN